MPAIHDKGKPAARRGRKAYGPPEQGRRPGYRKGVPHIAPLLKGTIASLFVALVAALAPSPTAPFGADEAQADTATYYVDAVNGSDSNDGTSPARAWATIGRANALDLGPGDQLLFKGGQTFVGNLRIDASDAGTAEDPVKIGSYGTGRAKIDAGLRTGIEVYNAGGVEVSDLVLTGAGYANGNRGDGVMFYTDLGGATKLEHVRVDNVEVAGFGRSGVVVGAWPSDGSKSGFKDVRITGVVAHDNADAGIQSYGYFSSSASGWAHEDIYVADSIAYDNEGDPDKGTNSGSGIVLGDVNGAIIERSVAHHNGENNEHPGGGPIGIWAWDSNRVTIQHNESYGNATGTVDGGGFDFDGGVTNSVMQYNYSHDNAGAGYLLAQFAGARSFGNNVVRYNISENDAKRGSYGAIHFWNGNGANGLRYTLVHNNTVYVSPQTGAAPKAVRFDSATSNVALHNNIFVATGGVPLVDVASAQGDLLFEGNDYWAGGGAFKIRFGGATYASLGSWREATGQEEDGTADTGFSVDPGLADPGGGGTVGDAARLSDLAAYKLSAGSPMIDAAVDTPTLRGFDPSPADFFGTSPPEGAGYDIGAHEKTSPPTAPVARANSYSVKEDKVLRVPTLRGVLANDSDANADALTARKVKSTRHGKLTLRADGSVVYNSKRNFNGKDAFYYRAFDGKALSNQAKVTIRVRPRPH